MMRLFSVSHHRGKRLALESVGRRARLAFHRIPKEVRNVVVKKGAPDDGTTTPMRPLPGGARMYPETDVPTIPHSRQSLARNHREPANATRRANGTSRPN